MSESEKKLINLDIVVLILHTMNQAPKNQDAQHNSNTRRKKNELSGLGLDPRIVVETGENWLSFALSSSQFLKYLQGNFQNLNFTIVLLHNLLKKITPPQSKITLSHTYLSNKLQKNMPYQHITAPYESITI